ncbi:MAG: phosphomethylpyrimidine synthase ThiC [Candidatus Saccharicenans sp.]|nr:MAG: phosphomethylpyrimidine synthase [Candidatus Aminicenantes bacterium]HEK86523.1 phosphomethylpyrimidine synthase ThiC [Candidatus Aminicenantes bacterium]
MTLIEKAKKGDILPLFKKISREEKILPEELLSLIAEGKVVVPYNRFHSPSQPAAIGQKMRTKVNVNLGTSRDYPDLRSEIAKLKLSLKYKTDAVMDLSTGGNIKTIRRRLLSLSTVPLGTVPVYEAAIQAISRRGSIVKMTEDDLFEVIEAQAREGVDFMTVHCGLTLKAVERLKKQGRIADIVSRGGAFHLAWMLHNEKENPLYSHFDRLLEIARKYDITLSLGDGLRPGAIEDATDRPQIEELLTLGELVKQARQAGVQAMVEGPGHIPLDQVAMNIKLEKRICQEAPFYVLGPVVTDIAPGYDHIVSAIGGAIAAAAGADFLCYVTPAEHLGLPSLNDVKEGLIASRIAAHTADIVKGFPGAKEIDAELSRARKKLDWEKQQELSIDPEKFSEIRQRRKSRTTACSMCGEFCAMKIVSEFFNSGEADDRCS